MVSITFRRVQRELLLPPVEIEPPTFVVYPHKRISYDHQFDNCEDLELKEERAKFIGPCYQVQYPSLTRDDAMIVSYQFQPLEMMKVIKDLVKRATFLELFKWGNVVPSHDLPRDRKHISRIPGALEKLSREDFELFDTFIKTLNRINS